MFQSSPAPKGGRYALTVYDVLFDIEFQSSPAPKGGRYPQNGRRKSAPSGVSILARPEGRALHEFIWLVYIIFSVSILARPEGRALHQHPPTDQRSPDVSILARPEGRALQRKTVFCFRED